MAKNRKTPDMNLPVWFDGQNINEALFCEEFLQESRIIFANRAFFTPNGRVTDDIVLRGEVYEKLKSYTISSVPQKIKNIMELLKLEAMVEDLPPQPDRIHVANGTLMLDGRFIEGKKEIVQSRLPVSYNPNAAAPALWLNFLDGLLYEEDIPTLQEFIGYCLIPSNKGQRMMVIKGNGGEGKSQIGAVLSTIFGTNMKDGSIGKISENRFARVEEIDRQEAQKIISESDAGKQEYRESKPDVCQSCEGEARTDERRNGDCTCKCGSMKQLMSISQAMEAQAQFCLLEESIGKISAEFAAYS